MDVPVKNENTKGIFGTLNVDYIRNNNFYYWEKKTL